MRFTLALPLFLLSLPLCAAEGISLKNDREGNSFYRTHTTERQIERTLREFKGQDLKNIFKRQLKKMDAERACAYDLNQSLRTEVMRSRPRFDSYPGVIHYLRSQNEIDDVVVKLLLDAEKAQTATVRLPKNEAELRFPRSAQKMKEMVAVILDFENRFLKNTCFDDAFKSLVTELQTIDRDVKSAQLEALFTEAHTVGRLPIQTYLKLERARMAELEDQRLSLKSYVQKISSLRANKPLRDPTEKSGFVTEKFEKTKISRRTHLLENYSDLQIMLMADLVKRLRTRIDSRRIEIIIYSDELDQEVIPLEPMERFRFSIKLLRKEMANLSINTYFQGQTPQYMDLMTAAYETSLIPASELEQLAGMEDLWNPAKTLWDRAEVWVRTFSSVATVAAPAPYGFIPALVLVVIEMYVDKDKKDENDETSLF